jgi:hypothetical protein
MRASKCGFLLLLAALATTCLQALPGRSSQLLAVPPADKFEDLAQFNYGGGTVSGTGVRDKGGFTVVAMQAAAGRSKLSVSFAVKEEQQHTLSDFRVAVTDAAGKRHEPSVESKASAGGNGIMLFTFVLEFNLTSDKINSLVIQQRTKEKK